MTSFLLASRFYVSRLLLHFLKGLGELRLWSTFRGAILLLIVRFRIVSLYNSLDGCIVIIDSLQAILHFFHSPVPQRLLVFFGHRDAPELRLLQFLYRIFKFAGLSLAIGAHLNLIWFIHRLASQPLNKLRLCNLVSIVLGLLRMLPSLFIVSVRHSCRFGGFIYITSLIFLCLLLFWSAVIRVNRWLFEHFLFFLGAGLLTWLILRHLKLAQLWFILERCRLASGHLLHLSDLVGQFLI